MVMCRVAQENRARANGSEYTRQMLIASWSEPEFFFNNVCVIKELKLNLYALVHECQIVASYNIIDVILLCRT